MKEEITMIHGCPKRIQTDGGKQNIPTWIDSFFAKFNFVHEVAVHYHPQSIGIAKTYLLIEGQTSPC